MLSYQESRDLDELLSVPVQSKVEPRWERKQREAFQALSKSTSLNARTPGMSRRKSRTSKTPGTGRKKTSYGDRFIPDRDAMNTNIAMNKLGNNENVKPMSMCDDGISKQQEFNCELAKSLFQGDAINSKILAFKKKAPKPTEGFQNDLRVLYTQNKNNPSKVARTFRHISSTPERILDAPDLLDDYYLNLLDWSRTDLMAVALGSAVYLWNAASGEIEMLCETKEEDEVITSVKWMQDGSHIALGTSYNDVQMWNVERKKQVRSMKGHLARVGSLAWNNHILSSGSRDQTIQHHDVRIQQHRIATLTGHQQEICGLAWSPDGSQLASGGNDNVCCIWDAAASTPKYSFTESSAAVKALAWCPWQKNVLATGGGTADRHIRFYNTATGGLINSIDTKSQVTSLIWSPHEKEILSSHGFSQNQLCVWKYPTMAKVAELTGHTSRILNMALSADGTTVCSAAADETLRFWKIWDKKKPASSKSSSRGLAGKGMRSKMQMKIR